MVSQCPHCEKALNLNEAQQAKIKSALDNLKEGSSLKLGCPHCKKAIVLKKDGALETEEKTVSAPEAPPTAAAPTATAPSAEKPQTATVIEPPASPDISWLVSGMYSDDEVVEDVFKVLILMPEGPGRNAVEKAFADRGYQAEFPESAEDAIAQMRFVPFAAVVLHSDFDGDLATSKFHRYMQDMPMSMRRSIYYVLVGKDFYTLYDLEALANSANVVVNDNEVEHIDIIIKKGMQDYNELFGPYAAALKKFGG